MPAGAHGADADGRRGAPTPWPCTTCAGPNPTSPRCSACPSIRSTDPPPAPGSALAALEVLVKRNLHAGRRRSGGLSLNVLHRRRDRRHPSRHARGARAHRRLRGGRRGARHLRRRRLPRRPRQAPRAHPAARGGGRHPLGRPARFVLCGRDPGQRHRARAGRVGFTNFGEGIRSSTRAPASCREPTLSGRRATSPVSSTPCTRWTSHESAVGARDVPPRRRPLHNTEAQLHNTTKPVGIGRRSRPRGRAHIYRDGAVVAGGEDALRGAPSSRSASAR